MLDLAGKKIRNLLRKRRKCFKESAQFSGGLESCLDEMSCIVFKRFEEQITIEKKNTISRKAHAFIQKEIRR